MDCYNYEDLNASFSFEEPLFNGEGTIDNLCHTYLGTMDSFAEGYTQAASSNSGLLDEIETFSRIEISQWRPEDCLDWAGSVCRRRGIDQNTVDLWGFREYTGCDLLRFSPQDFTNLIGSIYGPLFHGEFQDHYNKREQGRMLGAVGGVAGAVSLSSSSSATTFDYLGQETGYESDPWDLTPEDIQDLDRYISHQGDYNPMVDSLSDMDLQEQFQPIKYEDNQLIPESVLQGDSPEASTSGQEHLQKIRPGVTKRPRGPKNWEFVIRLLDDPKTNPSLIRWEDQSQATFRLVQPTTIAKMWGQRSNKPNLTYDNFARGLRYHYSTGALQAVSEKQLVYRCGPKALKYLIDLKKVRTDLLAEK